MLRLKRSILGAALLAGLAAAAVATPVQSADARPVWGPHGHWVQTWHDGRYGWWWTGPDFYWYPAPVYYDYPPPPDYVAPAGPTPQPTWYYCDSAKGVLPLCAFLRQRLAGGCGQCAGSGCKQPTPGPASPAAFVWRYQVVSREVTCAVANLSWRLALPS
jgi:hypothetical protein